MARKRAVAVAIGAIVLLAPIASGCTGAGVPTPGGTKTANPASPTAPETPSRTDVTHYTPPQGEDVVTSLDNQVSSGEIGVFPVTHRNAVIYLTCDGEGTVTIAIDPVGTFPVECATTGAASENQFDVGEYTEFRVGIESEPGQTWAVTVTSRD